MRKILIALAILLLCVNQFGFAASNSIRYSPDNGGFSIEFESAPKEFEVPNFAKKEARTYQCSNSSLSYSQTLHYRNLTQDFINKHKTQEILEQMRDAGIASNAAKIAWDRNINISNLKAKDVLYIRNDGGQTRARYVVNKGRFYAVIVTATKEEVLVNKRNLEVDLPSNRFLTSFNLKNFY